MVAGILAAFDPVYPPAPIAYLAEAPAGSP